MSIDRHSPKPHTAAKTLAETVAGAACGLMWDKDILFFSLPLLRLEWKPERDLSLLYCMLDAILMDRIPGRAFRCPRFFLVLPSDEKTR